MGIWYTVNIIGISWGSIHCLFLGGYAGWWPSWKPTQTWTRMGNPVRKMIYTWWKSRPIVLYRRVAGKGGFCMVILSLYLANFPEQYLGCCEQLQPAISCYMYKPVYPLFFDLGTINRAEMIMKSSGTRSRGKKWWYTTVSSWSGPASADSWQLWRQTMKGCT